MKLIKTALLSVLLLFAFQNTEAQYRYATETEAVVGDGLHTPFWMMNNRHGLSSPDLDNGYLRAGVFKDYSKEKVFDYRFGFDAAAAYHYSSKFVVQQAYLDILYKKLELSLGSKEYPGHLKNQSLSSGGLTWSGNARPIPMVRLSTSDYVSFPWLFHDRLKIKAAVAYGWFTDGDYQARTTVFNPNSQGSGSNFYNKNVLYHQKELFMRYDVPESPWSFTVGLEFDSQFCGEKYYLNNNAIQSDKVAPSFKYYLMALIPLPGDKNSPAGDQQYVFGNTLGSEHFVIHYHQKDYELKAYLENYFDDFGGMSKQNGWDGLWGFEYKNNGQKGITGVVLEYLQTTDQSGPIHWAPHDYPNTSLKDQATGNDDYYNNYYYSGWAHWGMTNGNPLLTSPVYNTDGTVRIQNNRVKAYHLGVSGAVSTSLSGRILATYSDGWGRHYNPFLEIKSATSLLLEINFAPSKAKGWTFTASGGHDSGSLYGNNTALSLKISKKGNLFN